MSLKFKIYKNSENLKDFMLDINLSNWMEYRRTLTSFKKSVNEYLTELVGQEKSSGKNFEEYFRLDNMNYFFFLQIMM